MATAKHRAIDRLRRSKLHRSASTSELAHDARSAAGRRAPQQVDEPRSTTDIGDDLLRLVFIACHPVLSTEAQVALTLRLLGGLTTDEIARAFLVPEPTDRAAHRARQAHAGRRAACRSRCRAATSSPSAWPSVLEVIYLIFNEGYAATAGDDWMRPALCEEALRLGRILAGLMPRRARSARPGGADGDPGLARRARASAPTASRCCCSTRIARAGIRC